MSDDQRAIYLESAHDTDAPLTASEVYASLRRGVCPICKDEDGEEVSLEPYAEQDGGPYCPECSWLAWDSIRHYGIRPKLCARCGGDGRTFDECEREFERCDECCGCGLVVSELGVVA